MLIITALKTDSILKPFKRTIYKNNIWRVPILISKN